MTVQLGTYYYGRPRKTGTVWGRCDSIETTTVSIPDDYCSTLSESSENIKIQRKHILPVPVHDNSNYHRPKLFPTAK